MSRLKVSDLKLRPIKRRERSFEYALRDELKRQYIGFVKLKPTITGFPDRLAMGFGSMRLVETKCVDGVLSEGQRILFAKIKKEYGLDVIVVMRHVSSAATLIRAALLNS